AVALFREVFADGDHARSALEEIAVGAVVLRSPGDTAHGHAPDSGGYRPEAADDLEGIAAHEAARAIGFVELLAHDAAARRPAVPADGLIKDPHHHAVGMEHQILADETAAVGEPVGEQRRARVQQQPRRADAVARQHDDVRLLPALDAVFIV